MQAGPWLRDSTEEVLVTSQDDYDSQDIASLNNTQPINLLKTRNNTGVLECLAEYLPVGWGVIAEDLLPQQRHTRSREEISHETPAVPKPGSSMLSVQWPCTDVCLQAITGFSSTGGQITFTNAAMDTSAVKNLTACIRNVTG